jgi:hypothetical protein
MIEPTLSKSARLSQTKASQTAMPAAENAVARELQDPNGFDAAFDALDFDDRLLGILHL